MLSNQQYDRLLKLRAKSEKIVQSNQASTYDLTNITDKELIHELQVHQVELEIQNEELRRAQLELDESRSKYVDLFDNAPVGYFTFNKKGAIMDVNLTGASLMGSNKNILINKRFGHFIKTEHETDFFTHCNQVLKTKKKNICVVMLQETEGDETWIHIESIIDPIRKGCIRSVVTDITKSRKAEEQLRQHQIELAHLSRLITVEEMAASIYHELSQPLNAITNYASACINRLEQNKSIEQIEEGLSRIIVQSERAVDMISRFRNFLKKGKLHKTNIKINDLIQEALCFIEHNLSDAKIEVIMKLQDDLCYIRVDKTQIEQVIINIAYNAIEAMRNIKHGKSKFIVETLLSNDNKVIILLSNTGASIPERIIKRIFNPFFTTKTQGMGMGLCISRSIIMAHGGTINVTTSDNNYTQFRISLPVAEGA